MRHPGRRSKADHDMLHSTSCRAVRIMEQRYFEQRAMLGGMAPGAGLFDGYRKGRAVPCLGEGLDC
jgi:hypothetical protein